LSDTNSISQRLLNLFGDAFRIDPPAPDIDLIETGILDSLQLVELLYRLEQEFGARIPIEDIDLDDLRTLERITRLVVARTTSPSSTLRAGVSP
jgi:D-alanine--poly(phosphoribitol) ligase subunit 2